MRFSLITLAGNDIQKVREQGGEYVVAPRAKDRSLSVMCLPVCLSVFLSVCLFSEQKIHSVLVIQ
jgi:hypothetical protein